MSFQDVGPRPSSRGRPAMTMSPQHHSLQFSSRMNVAYNYPQEHTAVYTNNDLRRKMEENRASSYNSGIHVVSSDSSSGSSSPRRDRTTNQRHPNRGDSSHFFPNFNQDREDELQFVILGEDILRLQTMIREIEKTLTSDQGRAQELMSLAEELHNNIERKLLQNETVIARLTTEKSSTAPASRLTHLKLTRDFRRVQPAFKTLLLRYKRRHQQGMNSNIRQRNTMNGGGRNWPYGHGTDNLSSDDQRLMQLVMQREEEYSLKLMREREAEVMEINRKMHQVNEIYKDLGQIVQSQQQQIDKVEDTIGYANMNAQGGLEHIEKANKPSMLRTAFQQNSEEKMVQDNAKKKSEARWPSSFDTIQYDVKEVQKDIMEFSNGIVGSSIAKLQVAKGMLFRCASMADVSESPIL